MTEPIPDYRPFAEALANDFNSRLQSGGLTLIGVAERSGVNMSTLEQIRSGRQLPNTRTILRLAVAFGVHPDKLLECWRGLMPRNGKRQ